MHMWALQIYIYIRYAYTNMNYITCVRSGAEKPRVSQSDMWVFAFWVLLNFIKLKK